MYRRWIFPLLRRFDAERTHEATLAALATAQRTAAGRWLLRRIVGEVPQRPVCAFGLTFRNVLGVAAGFDKDVRVAPGLALLGFGHVEVGTLTPWPQAGNPRPRLFRLPPDEALINRMGFPNAGMVRATQRLRRLSEVPRSFVLGVSLGKQKETSLAEAGRDYVAVMRAVYPYADYLAVNVSSPNTPGLRALQGSRYLGDLLGRLVAEKEVLATRHGIEPRPLLLKIAPDLEPREVEEMVAAALAANVDGMIATNTTTRRDRVVHPYRREQGGLSGAPLRARSRALVAAIHEQAGAALPLIGVGGVFTAADAHALLAAGASLVQTYTGLVYEGPGMAGRLLRGLEGARKGA